VPIVVHTIHGYGFNAGQPWPVRRGYQAIERLASRLTTRFIAVSRANLEQGIGLGLFTPDRVSLIRSGVRLGAASGAGAADGEARLSFRRELGLPPDAPIVGMVACLKP